MGIRVFIVDDHPMTRAGLLATLEREADFEVVGTAADGIAAWNIIGEKVPDVALVDIRMPGEDGVSLVRRVKESGLPVRSLMLTSYDAQQYVMASLRAGAKGYILKTASPEELARAIRTVARGGIYLDAEVSRVVGGPEIVPATLSNREREALILTSKGLSSQETASRLIISERTVQTHLASIYDKLGARNKTEAMLLALKYGVMTLEELLE